MKRHPAWLLDHKRDVYSQTGEDGVIEKILETLPAKDGWCVEFGAWDGKHLTNTRNLIESKNYSAVLIEANSKRFKDLEANYAGNESVVCLNRFVGFEQEDNLDEILKVTNIPVDFDLLSIDIDGNDYHVWKAASRYRPKLVVIEFNPTIATEIRFVQPPDPALNQGCSLMSLVELGKEKGYELIAALPFNAFFVRTEFFDAFGLEDNRPEKLRIDLELVTHIFSGYDGRIFLSGNKISPWHGFEFRESRFQQLPSFIRKFPETYKLSHKIVYAAWLLLMHPRTFRAALLRRLRK